MDSGRLVFFDPSPSSHSSHMLIFSGGSGNSMFQGARSMLSLEEEVNKRRHFFTSPEELQEEEYYYDEQLELPHEKKRRLTPEQVLTLERSFEAENKLEPERKGELAKKLGLQPRQVAIWFQNRRARWKTKQLEHDYDRLKAAYDSLLADYDAILRDNDHLRSQVATLSEKLHANETAIAEPTGDSTVHMMNADPTSDVSKSGQLSMGSGGSAVVDGEGPQLVDSCGSESYFHDDFGVNVGPINGGECGGVHSEEEDEDVGSDEGCNYIPAGAGGLLMFGDDNPDDDAADNYNWWGVWN